ncbi:DUF6615 family protein [Thalassospira sp.]|uniref:DUF6615 family protein n=1 Tax=Thalassospira sp. TaxID=1912094 RepID=UPI001B18968D|nr:DUF6615 family protein [Thalassospira sp.]MBO6807673.1 hypothetical protein [Thalassospira sp.]MBO6840198.1 hypothetical protein [Thalassospira sp.]
MLCSFARIFPTEVERFLAKDRQLRRHIREETITDLLVGGILGISAPNLVVDFSDEVATGADMEWIFYDASAKKYIRIFIQAKRSFGSGKYWQRHSLRELFHRTKSNNVLQSNVLASCAKKFGRSSYPLYFVYNPELTCSLARSDGVKNIAGVNLMDGYLMNFFVNAAPFLKVPHQAKSLKMLHWHFKPLSVLLCQQSLQRGIVSGPMALSPGEGGLGTFLRKGKIAQSIPTPSAVLGQLLEIRRQAIDFAERAQFPDTVISNVPPIPELSGDLPQYVENLIEGRSAGEKDAKLSVVFISQSLAS